MVCSPRHLYKGIAKLPNAENGVPGYISKAPLACQLFMSFTDMYVKWRDIFRDVFTKACAKTQSVRLETSCCPYYLLIHVLPHDHKLD